MLYMEGPDELKLKKKEATHCVDRRTTILVFALFTFLVVVGCDEAGMMKPVVPVDGSGEPTEPTDPTTNGEVKQPGEPTEPEPEPTPQPTVVINVAAQNDDGSVTVSGASAELPKGTKVTVTLGDAVAATTKTNAAGVWTVTIPVTEAEKLSAGKVAITATAKNVTATGSVAYTPPPQPTVTIVTAAQADDGSVTVSGTSENVPAGTTVTVTLGDVVTATATTDSAGAWTVTVPAVETEKLTVGTVTVTVAVAKVSATGSYEHTVQTTYGIPTSTKADEIRVDIFVKVFGYDHETATPSEQNWYQFVYDEIVDEYDVFDVETESGREIFQRLAEYYYNTIDLNRNPPASFDEKLKLLDQIYEEGYGISVDFAYELLKIYIEENPDEKYLFGRWDGDSVGIAWLLVKQAHLDATEEELLEHFRQAARDGTITITS